MKARLRSGSFASTPQLHTVQGTGTLQWTIPADNEVVAVGMRTAIDHAYLDKWNNHVKITGLTATLRDDTPPTATLSGPLAAGGWHNQAQPIAVTVNAADAGAGVKTLRLLDAGGTVLDSASTPATSASQPGATSVSRDLMAAPAGLGDGTHTLTVTVLDAAGEQVSLPLTVNVDAHAPTASGMTPAQGTTDRRPHIAFQVDGGPSGLGEFDAWLDGQAMAVSGSAASADPASDLAFGAHTVSWHATDGAGNARDGQWTFQVLDQAPPAISAQAPADGWSGELRTPQIAFTLTDDGTGVDPSSLRVALDGADVTAAGDFAGGRFTLTPQAPLGFGSHTVRVLAADRSGNDMPPAVWHFSVVDITPPVISDLRPDPNSAGSDRTPPIAFAVDDGDGSGIDPATLAVTLDGADVSASGSLAGGRFSFTPGAPLGFGSHTVTARVADRAGNPSVARSWSFTVRDETPPVIGGRLPVPGVTVPGAASIGFDVTDTGTGVDASSLHVLVDGSDVISWGSLAGGHFSYSPGNLGAGVHTVSVTVADVAGNQAGPVMWQFAVAKIQTRSTMRMAWRNAGCPCRSRRRMS
jgi:large repetitive protein